MQRIIHVFILFLSSIGYSHSEPRLYSYEDAQLISQATGKLLAHTTLTRNLLDYCTAEFKHLHSHASDSLEGWLQRNKTAIDQSKRLYDSLIHDLATHESEKVAEKYRLEMDTLIFNSTKEVEDLLAGFSGKDRHRVCNQLILSIDSNLWDLEHKFPQEFNFVMQHKF